MKIEEAILKLFCSKGLTLCLAESCTGGAIAAFLTSIPGASLYFEGSFVTYSNELKKKILNVQEETLSTHGAVSKEVAEEMCKGVLEKTNADYAIAVTGIAGPSGGSIEKPVGTVWATIQKNGELPFSWKIQADGNRQSIIAFTVNIVLEKLYQRVNDQKSG
mgnify:CR=1 FL=1